MATATFDFIVVGAGAAGAVLARRLADARVGTVALLEAGPSDLADPRIRRLADYDTLLGSRYDFGYSAARPACDGRLRHPRGRVLGGSTSINTCIWFMPPLADLRRWEAEGASGWGPEGTAAARARLAATVPVRRLEPDDGAARAWVDACVASGFPLVDFAVPFEEGVGWLELNAVDGVRQSAALLYLDQVPANLSILTDREVDRVLFQGRHAVAVVSRGQSLAARREIVLAAGAFNTPKLLMLSGAGSAAHLRALDIPVVVDLPGVGRNLQEHADCAVNWTARRAPARLEPWNWSSCLFVRLDPTSPFADLQLHLGTTGFNRYTVDAGYPRVEEGFSALASLLRPVSRGSVRLASPDPRAAPLIKPGCFGDPDGKDMAAVIGGLRLARRIAAAPPLAEWIEREAAPGADVAADDELADFVRRTHSTDYHPCGTCRIGHDADPMSVVTPDLRVRGLRGLRIADASVFPSQVSVNTAATCMLVGEKAADLVLGGIAEG